MQAIDKLGNKIEPPQWWDPSLRPTRWVGQNIKSEKENKNPLLFVEEVIIPEIQMEPIQVWALLHDFEDFSDDPLDKGTAFEEYVIYNVRNGMSHHLVQLQLLNYESDDADSGWLDARMLIRKKKPSPQHRCGIGFDQNAIWPTYQGVPMEYVSQFVLPERKDGIKVPQSVCLFLFWVNDGIRDIFKAYVRMLDIQTIAQHYADERKRGLW